MKRLSIGKTLSIVGLLMVVFGLIYSDSESSSVHLQYLIGAGWIVFAFSVLVDDIIGWIQKKINKKES